MNNDLQTTKSGQSQSQVKVKGLKTGYHSTSKPTSQIPGLSTDAACAPEEKARGRRVGVLETDSDYVKLAKQGGQKGLLWHEETQVSKPVRYTPSNWFGNDPVDNNGNQSNSEAKRNNDGATVRHVAPPFGTDADSPAAVLEDDSADVREDVKQDVNNEQQQQQQQQSEEPLSPSTKDQNMNSSFKKLSVNKKPPPVTMSKLLSFGYVEEEKATPGQ